MSNPECLPDVCFDNPDLRQVWKCPPIISVTWEADAGASQEPRVLRAALVTLQDPVSQKGRILLSYSSLGLGLLSGWLAWCLFVCFWFCTLMFFPSYLTWRLRAKLVFSSPNLSAVRIFAHIALPFVLRWRIVCSVTELDTDSASSFIFKDFFLLIGHCHHPVHCSCNLKTTTKTKKQK